MFSANSQVPPVADCWRESATGVLSSAAVKIDDVPILPIENVGPASGLARPPVSTEPCPVARRPPEAARDHQPTAAMS